MLLPKVSCSTSSVELMGRANVNSLYRCGVDSSEARQTTFDFQSAAVTAERTPILSMDFPTAETRAVCDHHN